MKVSELVSRLKELPQDAEVVIYDSSYGYPRNIGVSRALDYSGSALYSLYPDMGKMLGE